MLQHSRARGSDVSSCMLSSVEKAALYGNLGLIYQTRGELERAEEMLRKALAIDERVGMRPEAEKMRGAIEGVRSEK